MSSKWLMPTFLGTAGLFLMLTLVPFSKEKKQESATVNPAFSEYISAFTSGFISSESTIRVVLANEAMSFQESGKPIENDLFEFSPSIKGTATWIDNRTIEFKPETRLPSGQKYEAKFKLSEVITVPEEFKSFDFSFETIQQSFTVDIEGSTTTDKTTLRWQSLAGTITTADISEEADVIKVLTATQNNKKLKIYWEHNADQVTHKFRVDSIHRTEKEGKVLLEWNGKPFNIDTKGSKEIIIPALGDFKVMDIKVIQSPEQYLSIQFSDPILQKQNLEGLISIEGSTASKFLVDGNEIQVFPSTRLTGSKTVTISRGVKNILGYDLKSDYTQSVVFEDIKPQVRLVGKGVILPNSEGLFFPFEAVNLNAVDVKIVKIYEKNILQFLQVNNLEGDRELKRVGKTVLKKTIKLNSLGKVDFGKWNVFSLDLSQLIETEPGAIYKIMISFRKSYSTYTCEGETAKSSDMEEIKEESDDEDENWDRYSNYYSDYEYYGDYEYDEDYEYNQHDNPCNSAYYRNKTVSRNILASDIGLMAKRGTNGSMYLVVTDLLTAKPIPGTELEIYDYQQQKIRSLKTDQDGIAQVQLPNKPFVVLAKNENQRGYLKLDDGASLSLSMFDVSGDVVQKGIKGFIYGERGVWRPGDTLFLNFILEDKQKMLPAGHPVSFELRNPMGQVVKKIIKSSSLNGFYNFTVNTEQDAPTGNWEAIVKVGGVVFNKGLKIETIMPNRLKINLDFGVEKLSAANKNTNGNLEVKWLHGAIGKHLKAKIEVVLNQTQTIFKGFEKFNFDDPSRSYNSEGQIIFDGSTNEEGKAVVKPDINAKEGSPGMLKAFFTAYVFEQGGAFSIDRFNLPYSPYSSYVGIQVPEGNAFTRTLVTDTNHIIRIATVNENGRPVSRKKIKVQVYKINWRWWWDSYGNDLANYVGNDYYQPVQVQEISTENGKGNFTFRINRPDWGRFFIRVTDEESGHSTGQTVYIDWPSWAGSSPKGNEGANLLSFTSDKSKYNVGEHVKLTIPTPENGRALISIESGSHVIETHWVETIKGKTNFDFVVTPEMAPNIYVNATLLQPHAQTINDLPIRLYGIVSLLIDDPNTHLAPVVSAPEVWKPEEMASLSVSEKDGREMTYTVAIVDEGLLDLTRFRTPDPWSSFYAKEALGVKSWDMYDLVIGAYGGKLERILSIGGDGDIDRKGGNKANRFKPMVQFFGPFHLENGEKKRLDFMMPQYVGSVRVMVIAGQNAAYGNTDKTVAVRKPLMILGTLPRVVGPGEIVDLPVTVFAMEKKVKDVDVQISPNSLFSIEGSNTQSTSFTEVGDNVVTFKLKVKSAIGVGKVKILATSGSEKAAFDIELDVRNPNPKVTNVIEGVIEAGQTWKSDYALAGMPGTNTAVLELSSIPPINLGERLQYLIQYPHGCIEQTTSSVFPQLFLTDIMDLNGNTKSMIENNIKAGLNRLKSFQTGSGGFAYWPGDGVPSEWGTNYAGHFMLEAEAKGYALPYGLLENWKRYQKLAAQNWSPARTGYRYWNDHLVQAYRLYTLALAKIPDMGAMNRLKEDKDLSLTAKWRLAAAYALAGQPEIANKLILNLPTQVKPYQEMDYSYGSDERDEAMILETLAILGEKSTSFSVLKTVSSNLSSNQWMSTQTTAYALIGVSKFIKKSNMSKGLMCSFELNGKETKINSQSSIVQSELKISQAVGGKIEVNNSSKGVIFARLIMQGIPETGDQTSVEKDLRMQIKYTKIDGTPVDISKLEQGTDFIAEVQVTNPGLRGEYKQMALTQIFPSGWELHNSRMDDADSPIKNDVPTYQDIRDDRVYTYFDIAPAKTKTFRILLNASYIGKYYLPTVSCEVMYDNTINARKPGKWVEVVNSAGENLK